MYGVCCWLLEKKNSIYLGGIFGGREAIYMDCYDVTCKGYYFVKGAKVVIKMEWI